LLPHNVIMAAFKKEQSTKRSTSSTCGHMFADIIGYTSLASKLKPSEAFLLLSDLYDRIDQLCNKWGITKIDTIGDCYWCAVGEENGATQNDMVRLLGMALEMQEEAKKVYLPPHLGLEGIEGLSFRIGIHYGPCIGGIVGIKMPRYHLFGSHVEVANMLEQSGSEGCIHMSWAAGRFTGITEGGIVSWESLYPQSKAEGGDVPRTPRADASAHSKALMGGGEAMWHDMYSKGLRLTNSAYKIPDDKVGEIKQLLASASSGPASQASHADTSGSQLPAEDGSFHVPGSEFEVFPTCLITPIHLGSS
jgi:class 3 adenylate cyclase